MMKKFCFVLVMIACTLFAHAVPADNVTITHTQKDGTVLTLRLVGDEHMHYYLNVATGQAMRKAADGDFIVISDDELSANREYASQRRSATSDRRRSRLLGPAKVGTMGTMTGQKKGIVILVNFADKAMTTGTQVKFDNMFNQQGYNQDGHIGSVADYFKAQSYGQFELSFDVVGPVTLSNNMAYYGGNNSDGHDSRPGLMIKDACNAVNSTVNFADYDWTGNGSVDQVFVIYAGYGENYSGSDEDTIWPHEWDLYSATGSNLKLDGKTISTYACCAELYGTSGTTLNGMGTACHEFSHCLGYPDTYDIDYTGGVGMDSYDIMCGGSYNGPNGRGEVPAGFTAYERWMAGWLTPTELSSAANVTDMKDLGSEGEAYVIYNNSNKNEYFLLENRQSQDWFRYYDSNTAGHGLFITHVDFNQTVWNNNAPNDDPNHQRMTWVPADKSYGSYNSSSKSWSVTSNEQKGDYFPGTSNVTSFKPTASAWNTTGGKWFTSESGSYYTNHELSEITENTTAGTISFLFDGGVIDDGSRYTITLDACGGNISQNNWTQESYKEKWTLPEPTTTVPGWTGVGWLNYELKSYKSLDDIIEDIIDYGEDYEPTSNVTLYAVYADNDELCHSRPANYTVTLNAGAGSCSTTTWSQNADNRSLTLPAASISIDGWTFAGWTEASVSETNSAPSTLYAAGETYKPTANVTLYAVYKKVDKASGDNTFRLSTTLTAGNRYVFVTSNAAGSAYAISKDNLEDISSTNGHTTAGVAITVSGSRTVVPTDAMIWTCTVSNGEINLKNGTDYLGINGNGIGKRSTAVKLLWSSDYGLYGQNSKGTTSYYAKVNNSTIQTATNASTTGRIYAYEAAAAGSDITTYNSNPEPEVTPDPEPGEGGDEPGEGGGGDITITPISGIPAGYYNNTIVGKNDRTLELALKAIVNPHTKIAYNSLWKAYETTDVVPTALLKDPTKTDQVYDMYADYNKFVKYYSDANTDKAAAHSQTGGINREHCVPNSWWGGESGNATAYTDLHHLVPGDGAANNAKSNHPLGEYKSGMTLSWPTATTANTSGYTYVVADNTADHSGSWSHVWKTSSNTYVFEPADEFKGDFARMYLYVVCAYEGDLTWQTSDNTMFSNGVNNYTVISSDAKALLLKWHRRDPVSDKECLRNNAVQSIQGNRNPFIDYPVLAEYVWGDSIAKTTFSLETMPSSYQFGVTYRVGKDVTCSEKVRLCDRGSAVTLPSATTTIEGWTFSGWTTSAIANTTTRPAALLTGNYTPTENVELYAVFQAGSTYSITPVTLTPETPDTPDTSGSAALYFPHIAKLGQQFTEPAFTTDSDGAQTWTSSNTAVATVDNQGHVTIRAVGTTIITVTQAETATYKQGTASYMIKVIE